MRVIPQHHEVASEQSDALSYLRKESLDIFNRLHSIEEDIAFIRQVHRAYPDTPLLPNLRCGSWYTDPEIATDIPAYFKSTDGHFNNWSFNLRRANLHLLPIIIEHQGIIVVDSTRSGKRIPDALSKTVPMWCAVINRALLIRHPNLLKDAGSTTWNTALYTPPAAVSMQEHDQIEQRLDGWAQALAASSFSIPVLPCPLRPVWLTPSNSAFPKISTTQGTRRDFLPVICVSASRQIEQGAERRSSGFSYVQGSGDDHELWGMRLTPALFWEHYRDILATDRAQLPALVSHLVSQQLSTPSANKKLKCPTPVTKIGGRLLLCALSDVPLSLGSGDVHQVDNYVLLDPAIEAMPSTRSKLYIPVISGKRGQSQFLQTILPASTAFIRERLAKGENVCVACESGKDISVGVVLVALQLFFKDDGSLIPLTSNSDYMDDTILTSANKNSIRTRLEWIIASRPETNPSRTTLKRVNEFLLTPPSLRGLS